MRHTIFCISEIGENPRNQTFSRIAICLHNDNTVLATIMVDVMVMKEIEDMALRLGVDLSTLDLDAIRLPTGEDGFLPGGDSRVWVWIW